MIALEVQVPFGSWVKPGARQFRETEIMAPPSSCYGFLLSLVGEENMRRHLGARICPGLIPDHRDRLPEKTIQLRLLRKLKNDRDLADPGNSAPEYQEVYADVRMAIWLDSDAEPRRPTLEERVALALDHPDQITRYGPLSLGESCWLVNSIDRLQPRVVRAFHVAPRGRMSLSTWVDYDTDTTSEYASGNLVATLEPPRPDQMSEIRGGAPNPAPPPRRK